MFANRIEAGRKLAEKLKAYAGKPDVIVLGVPRGGVPVAFEVATALKAPLDILVLRKLGVPWQEELAFGAIAQGGVRFLDRQIMDMLNLTTAEVEQVTAREQVELDRRQKAYRGDRPPIDVRGRTVILVDDGIATGSSVRAAITALRQMGPASIVLAVPVADPTALALLVLVPVIVALAVLRERRGGGALGGRRVGRADLPRRSVHLRRGPFPDELHPLPRVRYRLSTDSRRAHNCSPYVCKALKDVSPLEPELCQGGNSLFAYRLETSSPRPFDRVHGFSDNQPSLSRQLLHSGYLFRHIHPGSACDPSLVVCDRVYIISPYALLPAQ